MKLVQINGLNPSTRLNVEEFVGQLRLREGQMLVGKILHASDHEVILALNGKTIAAQVEGQPLATGALALFKVALTPAGKVELKVLSQMPETALPLETPSISAQLKTLLVSATQTNNREQSPQNSTGGLKNIEIGRNCTPDLPAAEVWSFLAKHQLPLTAGTALYAWLSLDRRLRDRLWNIILNSSGERVASMTMPRVIELANGKGVPEQGGPQRVEQCTIGQGTPETVEDMDAAMLLHLLEESAGFETALTPKAEEGHEYQVPLLLRTPEGTVRECPLKWKDAASHGTDIPELQKRVKLTIATENLGEIQLTMLIGPDRLQVGLKADSGPVRDYLAHHIPDLQGLLGGDARVSVGVNPRKAERDGGFERWI